MSTKKEIKAGGTLTVDELTDDYIGAEVEVGPVRGLTTRMKLGGIGARGGSRILGTSENGWQAFLYDTPVKVIAPPPIRQPDEPTTLGQMFRVEGLPDARGFRARGSNGLAADSFWWRRPTSGTWSWDSWSTIKERVGDHRIIVSDPPLWPSEDDGPKAGDTFDHIEDVPYGWIAEVKIEDGEPWGHIVRYVQDLHRHRWDDTAEYGKSTTSRWGDRGRVSRSGGANGARYTLVETAWEHDKRVDPEHDALPEV